MNIFPGIKAINMANYGELSNVVVLTNLNSKFMMMRIVLLSIFIFHVSASAISTVTLHETKYPKSFTKSHRDLLFPQGMVFGPADELYITDYNSHLIFKYELGSEIEVFVGSSHGEKSMVGFRESAKLFSPSGIIFGKDGYLYVAAFGSHVIVRISLKGHVSVLAGKLDEHGYRDGSCSDSRFYFPVGITESLDGSILYSSEWWYEKGYGNNVIRSINRTSCEVKTVAGSYDTAGFKDGPGSKALFHRIYHIATHPVTGEIYICDSLNHAIRVFSPISGNISTLAGKGTAGYENGRLSDALFHFPVGIVIDRKGTVFASDQINHAIRSISPDGIVSTLAGGDVPGFYDGLKRDAQFRIPNGLCLNKDQMILYIADGDNSAIRMIGTQSGNTGTVMVREGSGDENGFGAFASFSQSTFITADSSGNIYVSDNYNNEIRVILESSGEVKTIAGQRITGYDDGWKDEATFNGPEGIVFVGENLFICDLFNNAIRMINASGYVSTFAGSGKAGLRNGYGIDAEFYRPIGITADNTGSLFVTDAYMNVIRKVTPDRYVSLYAGTGKNGHRDGPALQAEFDYPTGIVFNKFDDALYLVEWPNSYIRKISSDGMVTTIAGNRWPGYSDGQASRVQFYNPWQISLGPVGDLYIADTWNYVVRKITTSGNVSTVAGVNSRNPSMRIGTILQTRFGIVKGVYADPHSYSLIVADSGNNGIRNISLSSGKVESIAGYGSSVYLKGHIADNFVKNPSGIAFDPIKDIIYYANTERNVISSISINGGKNASRYSGTGNFGWYDSISSLDAHFNGPQGLEFVFINGSYSFLLVADTGNDVIRKINFFDGSVSTVAGNGENDFTIQSPLKSSFNSPRDIVYDAKESCIYVADSGNHVIRRVREFMSESTFAIAGNHSAGYQDGVVARSMFNQPSGLALLPDGSLLIADTYNHCIRKWNKTSRIVSTFAGTPGQDGFDQSHFNFPIGLAISPNGTVYIADSGNSAVRAFSRDRVLSTLPLSGLGAINAITFDSDGNLLIADTENHAIKKAIIVTAASLKSNVETLSVGAILGISAGGLVIMIAIIYYTCYRMRKRKRLVKNSGPNTSVTDALRMISLAPKAAMDNSTVVLTLTGSRTFQGSKSLSLPGYLELEIYKDIAMINKGKEGEGGTAKVKRGKLASPHLIEKYGRCEVAVKYYKSAARNSDAFSYEVAIMASLPNCSNIIQLLGFSLIEHAIVMRFYAGNLDNLIKSSALSAGKVIKIARDIANGMMHLHASKIIHFDLKPLNVLIDNYSNLNCVICDFGFAHFVGDEYDIVSGLYKPLSMGLTYAYAAPELLAIATSSEEPEYSEMEMKIDVYAYGMTMFKTVTRSSPFRGLSKSEIYEKVGSGLRPKFPESARTGELKEICELARQCWAQDPSERPDFMFIYNHIKLLK